MIEKLRILETGTSVIGFMGATRAGPSLRVRINNLYNEQRRLIHPFDTLMRIKSIPTTR